MAASAIDGAAPKSTAKLLGQKTRNKANRRSGFEWTKPWADGGWLGVAGSVFRLRRPDRVRIFCGSGLISKCFVHDFDCGDILANDRLRLWPIRAKRLRATRH